MGFQGLDLEGEGGGGEEGGEGCGECREEGLVEGVSGFGVGLCVRERGGGGGFGRRGIGFGDFGLFSWVGGHDCWWA